jgi:hypothetical protein
MLWQYVETFNNIRDIIFSNYLVTKTDPMELNKRHRHWNWGTTISLILCYTAWIIKRNAECLFHREELGLCISKWNFDFTDTFWTFWKLNCHALYFKLFIPVSIMCLYFVNTAVSCQLCTSTKLIVICFKNIIFKKEVRAPWFSAQMYVFMLKYPNFR